MTKSAAFGTKLQMGIRQVETATIVGTVTGNGDASFTLTKAGMTGSGTPFSVAVLNGDVPATVATKAVAVMLADSDITAVMDVSCSGANITMIAKTAAADDATFNLAYTNDTCTGLTPDATSTNTTAGVALADIAQISNIGGPSLSADTEDVTTHDSTAGFEEHVVTILRGGEFSLDLVYDPNAATHGATSGLLAKMKNKTLAQYRVVFPGPYNWTMDGYCSSFEPGAPVDGALTATATIKVTGAPTLA